MNAWMEGAAFQDVVEVRRDMETAVPGKQRARTPRHFRQRQPARRENRTDPAGKLTERGAGKGGHRCSTPQATANREREIAMLAGFRDSFCVRNPRRRENRCELPKCGVVS